MSGLGRVKNSMIWLFLGLFMALFCWVGMLNEGLDGVNEYKLQKAGQVTLAQVTAAEVKTSKRGIPRHEVKYQFEYDGRQYGYDESVLRHLHFWTGQTDRDSVSYWVDLPVAVYPTVEESGQLEVIFLPDYPRVNRPVAHSIPWLDPLWGHVMGTIFFGLLSVVGLLLIWQQLEPLRALVSSLGTKPSPSLTPVESTLPPPPVAKATPVRPVAHAELSNLEEKLMIIEGGLRTIQQDGSEGNYVIFDADRPHNIYVQFAGGHNNPKLRGEVSGPEVLAAGFSLNPQQIDRLYALGWQPPTFAPNYFQEFHAADDQARCEIARIVVRTLEVFGIPVERPLENIDLHLE